MNIAAPEWLFPTPYVLSDRGIRQAIEQRTLKVTPLSEDQIQPASLDLRIGQVKVYDEESRAKGAEVLRHLTLKQILDYEPSDEYAKMYPDKDGIPIDIPSGCYAEIFFHERIQTEYMMQIELRSSRGRLGLQLSPEYISNGVFCGVWNWNPNTIRLYGQTKFAQAFIHTGEPGDGQIIFEDLAETFGCRNEGAYLLFELGDHIYKFKKIGILDTKQKISDEQLYDRLETKNVELRPRETTIAQLIPALKLPPDAGIRILHNIPFCQPGMFSTQPDVRIFGLEPHCVNAGWVDPGYEGNVTGHPMRRKFPVVLNKGDIMALGVVFKYNQPVLRPYGSKELGSHYQKSDGAVARS